MESVDAILNAHTSRLAQMQYKGRIVKRRIDMAVTKDEIIEAPDASTELELVIHAWRTSFWRFRCCPAKCCRLQLVALLRRRRLINSHAGGLATTRSASSLSVLLPNLGPQGAKEVVEVPAAVLEG